MRELESIKVKTEKPHKKLKVWQLSIELVKHIYRMTENFPDKEKFGLISQLRRASVSISSNIAEGAARNTKKEFINFLHIASGSLSEIDTLLIISKELNFLNFDQFNELNEKLVNLDILLKGLIKKLKS